jgi:hypothetical protein
VISSNPVSIVPYWQAPGWDGFVEAHPRGSILHTRAMIEAEAATKLHTCWAHAAIDSQGQVVALLVAVRVATLGGIASTLASRSVQFAEPIFLDSPLGHAGVDALIQAHDQYMVSRCLFAEVRPLFDGASGYNPLLEAGYDRLGYWNYELDLQSSVCQMFQQMNSKCRNNIRSSDRRGVTVVEVDPQCHVDVVYDLVVESYAHSKMPVVDRSLFESSASKFGHGQLRALVAYYRQRAVAATWFLAYKKRVICWYAGTCRLPGIAAQASIFWRAMQQFSVEGFQVLDFAGAGWEGEDYGPGRFKAKFGGTQTNHGRYRKVYSPWKLKAATSVYQRIRDYIAPRPESTDENSLSPN